MNKYDDLFAETEPGVLVSVPATRGLNRIGADLMRSPNRITIPPWLFVRGIVVAVVMGVLGAIVGGWRIGQLSPLAHLRK